MPAQRTEAPAVKQQVTPGAAAPPDVTAEERHRLAECCAFFKAEHFREAAPGHIRHEDVEKAEAEIDAVVKSTCGDK
jgi:hypothetical protein